MRLKILFNGGAGAFAVGAFAALPLSAQEAAAPACKEGVVAPSEELSSWASSTPLVAAASPATSVRTRLVVGRAARLALSPTPQVRYLLSPEKPGGSSSYGGLVRVDISEAGTYRVALGSAAWVDLVSAGKAMTSSAHGHGPDCTGIRKMVDFPLTPGRYTLQVAGSSEPQITVMMVRRKL